MTTGDLAGTVPDPDAAGVPQAGDVASARVAGVTVVHAGHGEVVKGSSWMVGQVTVTAVGGFLYWSLAAHVATKETVGLGSTLFAALLFVNYATSMGLPVAVARFCPSNTKHVNTLFNYAVILTTATSVVGSLGFLALAQNPELFQRDAHDALFGSGTGLGAAIFVALVTGQSLAVLVEVRLITLRLWKWVLARVIVVAVLRIPLLSISAISGNPLGLLLIMAGLPAVSGLVGAVALRSATAPGLRGGLRPIPPETDVAVRYTMVNYLGLLAAQAPQFVLPLVVNRVVTSGENASFYLAWTVTTVVFLVPHTIGQVVLAESSRDFDRVAHGSRVRAQVRTGLALAVGLMSAIAVAAFLFAGVGTRIAFGERYVATAELLPRLVLAGVPWAVTSVCLAYARVRKLSMATVAITLVFAVCTIVPCSLLVHSHGIAGAADGWLAGNVVAAILAVGVVLAVTRGATGDLVASPTPSADRVGA